MNLIGRALRNMKNLNALSLWMPEYMDMREIEMIIRYVQSYRLYSRANRSASLRGGVLKLRRLYMSGLRSLTELLERQPGLEAIGLFSRETNLLIEDGTRKLRWSLAQHRLSALQQKPSSDESTSRPIIFGIGHLWGAAPARAVTIFDYPLPNKDALPRSPALALPPLGGSCSNNPYFFELPATNAVVFKQIKEDLQIDLYASEKRWTNLIRLVLPDLSPASFTWAKKLSSFILEIYRPYDPFVHFSIIEPPLPPFQLVRPQCPSSNVILHSPHSS